MRTRRSFVQVGLATLAAASTDLPLRAREAAALKAVKVVIPQSSVLVLSFMAGKDAGVFARDGIDLEPDARPFAGFLAGLPSKQCMAVTYAGMEAIQKINEGLDWVVIGGGLTVVQDIIVRKDSPLRSVADLRGKKLGTFSTGAGSFKAMRVAILDAFKLDIVNDTHLQQVAGPALTKLLERGEVDAMMNISSLSLTAESRKDTFRVLFSPNAYWKQKTGYPIVWASPTVAWRSWVDEDMDRARKFATATADAFKWLAKPENLEAAVRTHGTLAGVTEPAVVAEYQDWLQHKDMFMTDWSRKAVEAQWQFLETAHRNGMLEKVPDMSRTALFVDA